MMTFHTTAGGLQRNKEQTESVARLRDGDRATEGGGPLRACRRRRQH